MAHIRFSQTLKFESCEFKQGASLELIAENVEIHGLMAGGSVSIKGTISVLSATELEINGDLILDGLTVQKLDLAAPEILQSLSLRSAQGQAFHVDGLKCGGSVYATGLNLNNAMSLNGANIGGVLDLTDSTIRSGFSFNHSELGGSLIGGRNMKIFAGFSASATRFHGEVLLGDLIDEELPALNFSGTSFEKDAYFQNVKIQGKSDFSDAQFHGLPHFHNSELFAATNFDRTEFRQFDDPASEACYRSLRHRCAEIEANRYEHMFFAHEMESRRRALRETPQAWLFAAYDSLSGYGRSIAKPAFALVLTFLGFLAAYGAIEAYENCDLKMPATCEFKRARIESIVAFSTAQTFPFLPVAKYEPTESERLKWTSPNTPVVVKVLGLLQGLINIVLFFLLGLGIRNLFRLK